jgi:UDP-N-acetylmuramate--alanine ligase
VIGTLFQQVKDIHFVGIGGIGMSGIAEILLALGFHVSGSDLKTSSITDRLRKLGAEIFIGHDARNIGKADVVVYSSAVDDINPELITAVARRIPVIPRAEMLAELMRMQTSIAVAGMHGKTTTTSMIAWILSQAGLNPTVIIGGKLDHLGSGAKLGEGNLLVAEADESDKSFLKLYPTIAIVTNMDLEHLDCYSSMAEIHTVFLEFISKIPFYGFAVLCLDDPEVQMIIPEIQKRFITYGFSSQAMFHGKKPYFEEGLSSCDVYKENTLLGKLELPMPGTHNLANALAAIAVADIFGVSFDLIREALSRFPGVQRRFTLRGEVGGISIIDDYGHHPSEIRAVIKAARQIAPSRVAILFQPHRYSRTRELFDEFTKCFHDSDLLYVMDIYAASEQPLPGITAQKLTEAIRKRGHKTVRYLPDRAQLVQEIIGDLKPGDMLITLGAGDVTNMGPEILTQLRHRTPD